MNKFISGKASVLSLIAVFVVTIALFTRSIGLAIADSGNPASISATYNTITGVLSASGTYSGAGTGGDKLVGYALFVNGANPKTPGAGSLDGIDTHTMHVLSTPTTASGSWSDSHTLGSAPTTVCVVIYDVDSSKRSDDKGKNDIPADSGSKDIKHNDDNSYEKNHDEYPSNSCVTPTLISSSPTPVPCDEDCPTPAPTTSPTSPSCSSDQHLDAAGRNCVSFGVPGPGDPGTGSSASTGTGGQVLGASTMAGTGSFEETLNLVIMIVGGLFTFQGAKGFKKAFKNA